MKPIPHKSIAQRVLQAVDKTTGSTRRLLTDYMEAHGTLEKLESSFVARLPENLDVRRELLLADPEYQRAMAEASCHEACENLPRTLTGPVSVLEGVRAVQSLASEIERAEWSRGLRETFLPVVDELRRLPLPGEANKQYEESLGARASALGVLLDEGIVGSDHLHVTRGLAAAMAEGAALRPNPSWVDSVVLVETRGAPDQQGSGVFLGPSYILTAAHVVARADAVRIYSPRLEQTFDVRSRPRVHPEWGNGAHREFDYALIEVEPALELGLPVLWDFGNAGGAYHIARYGYPPGAPRGHTGWVERVRNMFFSPDLQVPHGASGGGIFYEAQGTVYLVGITTNEDIVTAPLNKSFVGLALMKSELRKLS